MVTPTVSNKDICYVLRRINFLDNMGWDVGFDDKDNIRIAHRDSGFKRRILDLEDACVFVEGFQAGHEW